MVRGGRDFDRLDNLVRVGGLDRSPDVQGFVRRNETAVEVEIVHEDGLAFFDDEELSVIHFAQDGTEIIEGIQRKQNSVV